MIQRYGTRGPAMSLSRVMNNLLADPFLALTTGDGLPVGGSPLNVYEQDDCLVVEAEMPGFDPDDIDISIERGMLTIRGEMEDEDERKDRNYLVREYRRGTFLRSVRLPDTVDTEHVESTFDNGVLKLVFPKAEQARARRISVGGKSEGGRRKRRSNGQVSNSGEASDRRQGDGMAASAAGEPASADTGAQTGQPATAGTSTSS